MTWQVRGCPLRAVQLLAEALRLNAPGSGPSTVEALAVIAQAPSTAREIAEATGANTGTVSRALKGLRPHLRGGQLVHRAPLVKAEREPGARSWRYRLTEEGRELLQVCGFTWRGADE